MIYLDNGATSFPKPPEVIDAVADVMTCYCANPGRSGHDMAMKMARGIAETRQELSKLLEIDTPERILFTKNCTEAINLALKGILHAGDHVITTSMEHNSVIRPLRHLERSGVQVTVLPCDRRGRLSVDLVRKAIRVNTRMILITAASNVTGTKMPLKELGRLALRHGILFMVDGAQGVGHMKISVKEQHIDLLAAPGHKGLLGPQGTGFLYIKEGIALRPLLEGGTGTRSKEQKQPCEFPEGYEAGTVNGPGIIGLGEGVRVLNRVGVDVIEAYEEKITGRLQNGLAEIPNVLLYGPQDCREKTAVVAMNIVGMNCEKVALLLNDEFDIATRAGFHCSGLAHQTIGTGDLGCVRLCPGVYTSEREIEEAIAAVREIAARVEA